MGAVHGLEWLLMAESRPNDIRIKQRHPAEKKRPANWYELV